MTREEIIAAIARNKINARDTRFDEQMRSMFRKAVRKLEKELVAA